MRLLKYNKMTHVLSQTKWNSDTFIRMPNLHISRKLMFLSKVKIWIIHYIDIISYGLPNLTYESFTLITMIKMLIKTYWNGTSGISDNKKHIYLYYDLIAPSRIFIFRRLWHTWTNKHGNNSFMNLKYINLE